MSSASFRGNVPHLSPQTKHNKSYRPQNSNASEMKQAAATIKEQVLRIMPQGGRGEGVTGDKGSNTSKPGLGSACIQHAGERTKTASLHR